MKRPLLVCKGIAKDFQLRTSGVRNWLGQTLGLRNEEWLNGCMPGLCVAFAGSNSDVKPNDRLPITEKTHERCCTKKRCLKTKKDIRKTTRLTQRTQVVTNGYFGGYIGKRQPSGSLETKKCVDKLLTLRAKMKGRGKAAQLRASSGRLVTELEMNSTYRGAVEIFNLCKNLNVKDVLMAECIRTFGSQTIDGRNWMHVVETSWNSSKMKVASVITYIPPARKPNVRTNRSKVNALEAYGFRPMEHPWKELCAYEFLQWWRCEPLLVPTYYSFRNEPARTKWTQSGLELSKSRKYREGEAAAKPGEHFIAVEPDGDKYFLFPMETGTFRHSWVLLRKCRPDVVVIENLKMPSVNRPSAYNAQYCSCFFRPWTFQRGDTSVPHLSLLGMQAQDLQKWQDSLDRPSQQQGSCRLRKKTSRDVAKLAVDSICFRTAWDEYVRGNVHSATQAKLIERFLLNTMAATGKEGDDSEGEADASESEVDLPPMKLTGMKFQELITSAKNDETLGEKCIATAKAKAKESKKGTAKKGSRQNEYEQSHRIGERVWKTDAVPIAASERTNPGNMYEESYKAHLGALSLRGKAVSEQWTSAFNEKRDAAASYNPVGYSSTSIHDVLTSIMQGSMKPNQKQQDFLRHFASRLQVEYLEKQKGRINRTLGEPLLDLVHGFPGTGKSAIIAWMRQLMEEGLGWEHGVQFVCLAFQNAMAAQINGHTVHHWSGIPARSDDGNIGGDKHKQSMKCGALRVIIIDEVQLRETEGPNTGGNTVYPTWSGTYHSQRRQELTCWTSDAT